MSGRLIILPKKSYCPWNPKNVERVERDEREHREAEERKRKRQAAESAQQRSLALRQRGVDVTATTKRFSLFEEEERKHMQQQHEDLLQGNKKGSGRNSASEHSSSKQRGHFSSCQPESTPFYLKKAGAREDENPSLFLANRQAKRKRGMDPMKRFLRYNDRDAVRARTAEATSRNNHDVKRDSSMNSRQACHKEDRGVARANRHRHEKDDSSVSRASSSSSSSHERRRRRKRKRRHRDERKKRKKRKKSSRRKEEKKHGSKDA